MCLTDQILEACDCIKGMGRAELVGTTAKPRQIVGATIDYLINTGRLYKAGVHRHYRYFVNQTHAELWDLVAPEAYEAARQTAKGKRLADKARRERERNRAMKPYRTREIPKAMKRVEKVARQEPAPTKAESAKVVWPDTVKVQVIPTPLPRFAFQPTPGWRGAITQDWYDRRLNG